MEEIYRAVVNELVIPAPSSGTMQQDRVKFYVFTFKILCTDLSERGRRGERQREREKSKQTVGV